MTETCPECGREYVEVSFYDGRTATLYVHEVDRSGFFNVVTDRCFSEAAP